MKDKVLTHRITRQGWPTGCYFLASKYSYVIDRKSGGYNVMGEVYGPKDKAMFNCFLIIEDESLFTLTGRD